MAGTNEGMIYARELFEGIDIEMLTDEWNAVKKFCACGSILSKIKDNNFLFTYTNNSKVIILKIMRIVFIIARKKMKYVIITEIHSVMYAIL